MKDYAVEKKVDYLTMTSHDTMNDAFATKLWQVMKPVNNAYDYCEMHVSGMYHLYHTRKPKLGHHYIMQGKCLDWIRANMMGEHELIDRALNHGNISRIDIAVTSMPIDGSEHELQPHAIMEMCRDGLLVSRMKPNNEIAKDGATETKYIGNPQKRRRLFRAYDKGIQLDLSEYKKREIRYELETGMNANVIARMVRDGNDIGAIIRRYVDFPTSDVWVSIMGADNSVLKHETGEIEIDAFERDRIERASKWMWLNESIAPMIKRLIKENETIDNITQYENTHLQAFMRECGLS